MAKKNTTPIRKQEQGDDPWLRNDFIDPRRDKRLLEYFRLIESWHGYPFILNVSREEERRPVHLEELFVEPRIADKWVDPATSPDKWPKTKSLVEALISDNPLVVLGDPGTGKSTLVNWLAYEFSRLGDNPYKAGLGWLVPLPLILRELGITEHITWDRLLENFLARPVAKPLTRKVIDELLAKGQAIILVDGLDELGTGDIRRRVLATLRDAQRHYPRARFVFTSRIVGYDTVPVLIHGLNEWMLAYGGMALNCYLPPPDCASHELHASELPPAGWIDLACMPKVPHAVLSAMADAVPTEVVLVDESHRATVPPNWADWELLAASSKSSTRAQPAPPSKDFVIAPYYVVPFDDEQIRRFARNWFTARERPRERADEKAAMLWQGVSQAEAILHLVRIPNLLTFIALICEYGGQFPESRLKLYDEIARAYLFAIDRHYKLSSPFPEELKAACLEAVAFEMQKLRGAGATDQVQADEKDVISWIASAMQEPDEHKALRVAADFLDYIGRRSGLLIPRGEGVYAFAHLSFQEYFAARYIADKVRSPGFALKQHRSALGQALQEYADAQSWHETLLLCFRRVGSQWLGLLLEVVFGKDYCSARRPQRPSDRLLGRAFLEMKDAKSFQSLTLLDLGGLPNADAALASVVRLPRLRVLRLSAAHVTDLGLVHLEALEELESLVLDGTQVTDAGLVHLETPRSLKLLSLNRTKVGDAGLVHLERVTTLETLSLDGTEVTDAGLVHLDRLQALKVLSLNGTKVGDAGLVYLEGATTLEALSLDGTQVTDAGLAHLEGLTALERLSIDNTQLTDASFAHLKALTALSRLSLDRTRVTGSGLMHLEPLKALTSLSLNDTRVTDAALVHLEGMAALTSLSLDCTPLTDAGLVHLKGLTGLSMLWLDGTSVTDAGLAHLKELSGLYALWLDSTPVTDAGLVHLKGLTGLSILSLDGTQVTDAGLVHLAELTGLSMLWLNGTKVTDAGLAYLEVLKALQIVTVVGTQVTDRGVKKLGCVLPKCKVTI